jgi:hypothetical protein
MMELRLCWLGGDGAVVVVGYPEQFRVNGLARRAACPHSGPLLQLTTPWPREAPGRFIVGFRQRPPRRLPLRPSGRGR